MPRNATSTSALLLSGFCGQIRLLFLNFLIVIINSIEEMKNVSKMVRDHKRLVLGSTGKNGLEYKPKENADFENYLRSHSYTIKTQEDGQKEPLRVGRGSLGKMDQLMSDSRRPLPKTQQDDPHPHPHSKHFTTHIQKREKLTISTTENTPPPAQKSRDLLKGKPAQRLFETSDALSIDPYIIEMLAHLREHAILATAGESHFTINRDHLKEILSNSISWAANMHSHSAAPKCTCPQLSKIMGKMMEKIDKDIRLARRKNMRLDNSTVKLALYQEQAQLAKVCESKIMKLKYQQRQLQEEVQKLAKYEQTVKQQCMLSQAMIEKKKRELQQLHMETQKEQEQLQRLQKEVNNAQKEFHRFLEIENKVKNYIQEQQSNKIVKAIFQQYKQIEADIYEYASYLQSNQLASDLFYEPHPFRAIEEQIEEELKKVNVMLIQGKDHTVEEKCIIMRDFVLEAMGKFRKKDEQMGKVIQFRTKCIHRFIENMKKWLNNWEFKQEFLVNLRKEFAYDSNLLMEKIQKVFLSHQNEKEAIKVKELTKKIIQNYQLGNSFY